MSLENEDQNLLDRPSETNHEWQKKLKILYKREFLLSLSELDVCRKLPSGFDQSILSEFEDSFQDQQRVSSALSSHSYRRNEYGSSPPTKGDFNSYSWGVHGRWESRSSGRGDKDSDSQSDWESDSGRRYGNQSRRSWQVEHEGLLGSGSFPRSSGFAAGVSAPTFRANAHSQLNKSNEPYHPPRPYKAVPHTRRETNDSYNDETFGFSESTSEDRAEEERKRRVSFELMRREHQKAFQEKQKLNPDKRKDGFDITTLLEDSKDEKSFLNRSSVSNDPVTLKDSHNDSEKSSFPPQTPASRPLVPPGFTSTVLERNFGSKSVIQPHTVEVVNPELENCHSHAKGNLILNGVLDHKVEEQSSEQKVLGTHKLGSTSNNVSLNNNSDKNLDVPPSNTIDVDTQLHKISYLSEAFEASENSEVIELNGEKVTGDKIVAESNHDQSTSILDNLFGYALTPSGGGSSSLIEHNTSKADETILHASQSSKFARWFPEEEKKSVADLYSSRPNDLLSLIVSGEKGGSQEEVSSDVKKNTEHVLSNFPFERFEPAEGHKKTNLTSDIIENSDQLYKNNKPQALPAVLTCEDLEQSILSEISENGSTQQLPAQALSIPDPKTEPPSVNIDDHASQHLLSLLQKGTGLKDTVQPPNLERTPSGIAGAVPPSLVKSTNIDAILQAADEIQSEDPSVSRILCEQAYTMAQNLDPNSDGRGVLQFKTGLMSVIKQKLAKRDGAQIDRNRDIEHLWEFYQQYKSRHRVDDIQKEEQKLLESGNFSANLGELQLRSIEMKKAIANLKAIVEVMDALSKDADPNGVGRLIIEELRRMKKSDAKLAGELAPYNIVPLETVSLTNAIRTFPEVRGAMSAIRYTDFENSRRRDADMFDLLEYVFGFQEDNVRNQRENVVLMIANAQSRLGIPVEVDPKVDEEAINNVFLKVLDNYIKWCKYLRIRVAWNSIEAINRDRKLFLVSLYFLIWGEAANVRFLPECICYIFHHMARELDAILDHGEANRAASCITESGSVSFLDQIICPIYETLAAEAARNDNGKAAHSAWRNYDDFNEYFWSSACFELGWPMKRNSSFLWKPTKSKRTGKSTFVEHRTFLHLYRSFHRLWIFLALMFQVLTILAFNNGHIDLDTFKTVLSIGPSFAIMNFIESCLDVLLMFGAYNTARGMAISRLVIRFFWCGLSSVVVTYIYLKVLQERNDHNSNNSFYFRIYILGVGIYAALRLVFAFLLKVPACHTLSEMSDQSFFQFFKWIYQERYYVGRGLFERMGDYCRYVLYWLVILTCKFIFAYFLQIKPLVKPTNIIVELQSLEYSWHDLISKKNNNALTVACLWAPVVAIYLMDIHIWYTVLSAIVGGVKGAQARLGEIRSIEMVHKRFESFPEAFAKNLVSPETRRMPFDGQSPQDSQNMNKAYAAIFSPFWNDIIKSLREEDYISNREMDLLSIPSNTGSLRLVQWPLFLLSSKILLAIDLALDCKDTQVDLWNRICRDEYMAYAVQECYYSVEQILHSLVDVEGRLWVERIFREINNSILEGSLVITLSLKKLPVVLSRFTALTGLLIRNEMPELARGAAKAVYELYDVVTHELLSSDLSEQLDTWNILARARNEGRLFSSIEWPKDPKIIEQVKRLHLLLTVKESAANVPKNLEARRRLEFFTNSLFMDMPAAKPVSEMIPFSVFTPYYSETVLYSSSELRVENEDGISILFYLQKIFPDEWNNFLERIGRGGDTRDADLQESSSDSLELRFWVSYRGQTLARTVRGMMYYRRALMLQSYLERRPLGGYSQSGLSTTQGFELSPESRAQADLKFTYVVSCQIYGQQKQKKSPEAADIALLLQRNEALRVAFIHIEESGAADGKVPNKFYSKLVKADIHGKDQEVYSIKLPGDPKLGEGKPENQNHAIIFTRGEAIQTIDMNQDNYLEEAMKMRNLLEEFRVNHGIRLPTILGVREHVFTGSVSSLALFMSNQETSFVTLGQRVLASPLKVRMHYGHPDVFDRIFHITRGGISKASRVINISEDIFAGFNSTLRQGNITHHEYIQVGKGRDVGLNQIALFEGKVAGGNGEQVLSRDVYRIGQLFDFFRMLSFFFTTVGYYVCTMMTVLTVYVFLYGRIYLAFSGLDQQISEEAEALGNTALDAALNAQFLVQIGVFTAVPMIMGFILELGLLKAVFSFITMQLQLCSVFFTFSLGTRTHYFGRTILHGGAKYRATGRGFVVRHIKFADNYRLYSRSHFTKALEVALLLIVYIAYGHTNGGAVSFVLLTMSSWFLVISWLFAPYIFNPSGFEWQKTVEDFDDWTSWLLYKGGVGVKGENSWESWWDEEQVHIKTLRGRILETILSLRFFIFQYGVVYKLHLTGKDTSLALYGFSWVVLVAIVLIFKVFTYSPKRSKSFQLMMRFIQGVASLGLVAALALIIAFTRLSIADLFASILAFIPTGWGILCLAIAWKKIVWNLGFWDSVREFARMYDAGMGLLIFTPIAVLSWFPFISTFQSRLLFNQAFSRGLEISIILAGNKANVES